MAFGDRIKARREELALSRPQLADRLGVTPSTVSNYETGVSFPKEEMMLRLFDCLETDPNTLFQDSFRRGADVLTQRERQLLPRHEALAHGRQPAFFRGQAAARVLRVQNGLGRVQRGGIGLVAEQLADGLLRPGGKQTALFGFIVFEGLQCGCEPGGRAEQRIRAFPVSGTEHLHPLRIRQRARRADLDAAEQLQLADQLRLLLRNAADPQLFHF